MPQGGPAVHLGHFLRYCTLLVVNAKTFSQLEALYAPDTGLRVGVVCLQNVSTLACTRRVLRISLQVS